MPNLIDHIRSTEDMPDDPAYLKQYIKDLLEKLGMIVYENMMLKEDTIHLKQVLKAIGTTRSSN